MPSVAVAKRKPLILLALISLGSTPNAQAANFFEDLFRPSRPQPMPPQQPSGGSWQGGGGSWFPWDNRPSTPPPRPVEPEKPEVQLAMGEEVIVKPVSRVVNAGTVADIIRQSIQGSGSIQVGKKYVNKDLVRKLYALRDYNPVFIQNEGPQPLAQTLYSVLVTNVANKGLKFSYYWPSAEIDPRARATNDLRAFAELDLLLTQSLINYANDISTGRTNPQDKTQNITDIEYIKRKFNEFAQLNQMLDPANLVAGLESLEPKHATYQRLIGVMTKLQAAKKAGGWPALNLDKSLKLGAKHAAIPAIRVRLFDLGLLPETAVRNNPSQDFDSELDQGIRNLQTGMKTGVDGVLGKGSINALQTSLETRIGQFMANIERYRLLPKDFGQNYIFVELGNQSLNLYQNGQRALNMKVIVGQKLRQTPSFPDELGSVIVNPYWFAPGSIVVKDILPNVMQDPSYFAQLKMRVFDNGREIDVSRMDSYFWSQYTTDNLPPYTFREDPGPNNSLGRIKFNLNKNDHAIYLHDTNHRELFANNLRILSSGCVRVEKPVELADTLLRGQGINANQINQMIDDPAVVAKKIPLTTPVPVYIIGTTVTVDTNTNQLLINPDIYGQDERIVGALNGLRVVQPTDFWGRRDSTL